MPNTIKYRINSKKSLCKSKKEKKCKKIKGCKMARGPKKTFCRKIKNKKYGKTMKKRGGMNLSNMANMANMANKASAMKTMANMAVDENKLKQVLNTLDEKKIKEFLSGINGLNEAQLKQLLSGDKNAIIGVIMQNKQLRSLVMKEMMNNSELRGLIIKLATGSMRGGNLTEDELESLERTYKHATPTELEKIMNDESKERKERSIAQKILFEKLKF